MQPQNIVRLATLFLSVLVLPLISWPTATAQMASSASPMAKPDATASDKPFVVEYYYKAKWGYADEFIALFRKNHYPVLKKEIELGRILRVEGTKPRYHTTEDGRWDYRITIVYKNAAVANDSFDSSAIIKQLYPDQDSYKKEEQRRFVILEAHWDLPIQDLDLATK